MIPEEAGNKEVAAQEREVIAAEEDITSRLRAPGCSYTCIYLYVWAFVNMYTSVYIRLG